MRTTCFFLKICGFFQDQACRGYTDHPVLKCVLPHKYKYKWEHLISFFQLQKKDFDQKHNVDYKRVKPIRESRGGLPYYPPTGWYCHALNVDNKYSNDKLWFGSNNIDGEWAVAFHGTHTAAITDVRDDSFSSRLVDAKRREVVERRGKEYDKPGLYVTTHCNGGAHPQYTTTFDVKSPSGVTEKYRVVFQCRVKPGAYIVHQSLVDTGHTWRFVDPEAIRPYGILIKNETTSTPAADDVEGK